MGGVPLPPPLATSQGEPKGQCGLWGGALRAWPEVAEDEPLGGPAGDASLSTSGAPAEALSGSALSHPEGRDRPSRITLSLRGVWIPATPSAGLAWPGLSWLAPRALVQARVWRWVSDGWRQASRWIWGLSQGRGSGIPSPGPGASSFFPLQSSVSRV